ncbi:DUF4192 domain-containing protein [Streptomyces sp. WAC 01325]|uniref:DUF4192 domain-containing protein n=1 Tax=Streptomyces sp. WAC 01325 TaxID=2203202 RepID=UPI000F899FB8|nr:DUF4192 domain-containing protein [Streptomyces sp. WAC 01325]RSM91365.1 DUF4192 domain-containing protein [Streptomyces sp. WAC 01325]
MTNHSEATGSHENDGITGQEQPLAPRATDPHEARETRGGHGESPGTARRENPLDCTEYKGQLPDHQVTLRTPAELADALPYLLGYRPEDSMVLAALHDRDGRGRFGGRARLGIPASADDWGAAATQLAHGLVTGSERRGARPEQIVAFLCQEPAQGETGRQVMERLRPLSQKMRLACGGLDVPVVEALCISDGRYWSYCCDRTECCPAEGRPMGLPGTSVLAAAAAYAGVQVRGTLSELRARLLPWETAAALEQEIALDRGGMALVPRILDGEQRAGVAEETLELAVLLRNRFAAAPAVSGTLTADLRDDELLDHEEAARLILGLQDRATRDRVAEWMEGDEAPPALRLWRALARRCVGPYREHGAAPLTLAGWVAWSTGDEVEAREAFAMALGADADYLFARLLHQACNEGLDPESIRRCLRTERAGRERAADEGQQDLLGAGEEPAGGSKRGETVSQASTSDAVDRRRSRHSMRSAEGLSRVARTVVRRRAAIGSRARTAAGSHPSAARPGGNASEVSKDAGSPTAKGSGPRSGSGSTTRAGETTAPRTARRSAPSEVKSSPPRIPKQRAVRQSEVGPDGTSPKNTGVEGEA